MSAHPLRPPRQVLAFCRKELTEMARQPRLLLVMVLGPFLVMAAFGLGYDDEPQKLRTVFVLPEDSPLLEQVESYADRIEQFVDYQGVVTDRAAADRSLASGEIDVIVAFPPDPLETVLGGEQAIVQVVHTRLDPIERSAISFVSSLAVDRINSEVLAGVVTRGQELGDSAATVVETARASIGALRTAVEVGDRAGAIAAADELAARVDAVAAATSLSDSVSAELGEGEEIGALADELGSTLSRVSQQLEAVGTDDGDVLLADLDRLDAALAQGAQQYEQVLTIDPRVLVQPLERDVQLAVDDVGEVTDWYAPAAVVLMLQQFGVAFAAMSFVRERQLGIDEVYRIAPLGAAGSLIGKYLAYVIVGGIIGTTLTALIVLGLDVPIAGSALEIAAVMGLTLFASVGLGFVLSLLSRTDAQAVQYTMIVLLASLFFSGFFLSLGQMRGVAGWIPYLLPVSYGMRLLRDVMLRGADLDPDAVVGLAIYGGVTFLLAFIGTHRRIASPVVPRITAARGGAEVATR